VEGCGQHHAATKSAPYGLAERRVWAVRRGVRRTQAVIRTVLMLAFWAVALPVAALLCFPWTFLTGDIRFLYRVAMWSAWTGVRLAGIRVRTVGLEQLDSQRNYVFMSNHVSNIDPPIM